jgi:hypothetical protein
VLAANCFGIHHYRFNLLEAVVHLGALLLETLVNPLETLVNLLEAAVHVGVLLLETLVYLLEATVYIGALLVQSLVDIPKLSSDTFVLLSLGRFNIVLCCHLNVNKDIELVVLMP